MMMLFQRSSYLEENKYSVQLGLCSPWLRFIGGGVNPNFFLCFSSIWDNLWLPTENQLCLEVR
jgi:hypothetical protein